MEENFFGKVSILKRNYQNFKQWQSIYDYFESVEEMIDLERTNSSVKVKWCFGKMLLLVDEVNFIIQTLPL